MFETHGSTIEDLEVTCSNFGLKKLDERRKLKFLKITGRLAAKLLKNYLNSLKL
jgi:hypothetical protein